MYRMWQKGSRNYSFYDIKKRKQAPEFNLRFSLSGSKKCHILAHQRWQAIKTSNKVFKFYGCVCGTDLMCYLPLNIVSLYPPFISGDPIITYRTDGTCAYVHTRKRNEDKHLGGFRHPDRRSQRDWHVEGGGGGGSQSQTKQRGKDMLSLGCSRSLRIPNKEMRGKKKCESRFTSSICFSCIMAKFIWGSAKLRRIILSSSN